TRNHCPSTEVNRRRVRRQRHDAAHGSDAPVLDRERTAHIPASIHKLAVHKSEIRVRAALPKNSRNRRTNSESRGTRDSEQYLSRGHVRLCWFRAVHLASFAVPA